MEQSPVLGPVFHTRVISKMNYLIDNIIIMLGFIIYRSYECFVCCRLFIYFISLYTYNSKRSFRSNRFWFWGMKNTKIILLLSIAWRKILCTATCFRKDSSHSQNLYGLLLAHRIHPSGCFNYERTSSLNSFLYWQFLWMKDDDIFFIKNYFSMLFYLFRLFRLQ